MRTTLTLDHDVVALLAQLRKDKGYRFKEAVNVALREGLTRLQTPPEPRRAYRTPAVDLGATNLPGLDSVSEVLAVAEGEDFR
ncbi:MAG: antitoxin [Acidobacteriota bacterium]|nr:antitoxin [Acidobacteriota bacterium]MDH3522481.1 antitoxin [Acidobacteriota bacterium]